MEHVVFYQSAQGAPAFRRVGSLEDAVSFAEHLRNVEGVTEFSVFSMSPVTLSMRAYYHVEVSAGDAQAGAPASAAEPAATEPPPAAEEASPFEPPADAAESAPLAELPPPLPPDAPPSGSSLETGPTPSMSFNALEEEATAPLDQRPGPIASVPFAAAPLPPTAGLGSMETFVKAGPGDHTDSGDAETGEASESAPIDPNVVDPTTEEVVPTAPSGRRSMGFFARS